MGKYTAECENNIINDYKNNIPVRVITETYYVSQSTVYRILDSHNIPRKTSKNKYKKYINDIVNDYNNGASINMITNTYGISHTTLYKIINKKGGIAAVKRKRKIQYDRIKTRIILEYLAGTPVKDICNKYGYTPTTLYNILKKNDIQPQRKHGITNDIINNVINDINNGISYNDISHKYGICLTTVYNIIKKYLKEK